MCSFLIFNWLIENLEYINYFLKFRGPDLTNSITYEGFLFLHNLLHLTGDITKHLSAPIDNLPYLQKIYYELQILLIYLIFFDYLKDQICFLQFSYQDYP